MFVQWGYCMEWWRMPKKPKRPCSHPGCPALVEAGERHCIQHKRQEQRRHDTDRGSAHQRGYTARWAKYAASYKREHPLCRECESQGRITPAYAVDHIQPVTGPDDPLFWDTDNHQPLCAICHSRKTATEKGWGRKGEGGG